MGVIGSHKDFKNKENEKLSINFAFKLKFCSYFSDRSFKTIYRSLAMSQIKKNQIPQTENKVILISVGANPKQNKAISMFARENQLDFMTYTETEWATLEEIDQYIQEEEISKQIVNLPIGANTDFSLDKIQKRTIKKVTQIKNINIHEAAKKLKIGRATLYRKLEKYGLNLKQEREKQIKKQAA